MKFSKSLTVFLITTILTTSILPGCLRQKGQGVDNTAKEAITLTFYGLFDSEDIYAPLIEQYESENPNIEIDYKRFTDPDAYLDLIINELAEGEGPDIFMMHNTWYPKHFRKLSPAPETIVNTDVFESLFVDIASDELIIPDDNGKEQVWGLPLYVDTLALYYNDDHIEDALPSQGTPSTTWAGIANDVAALVKKDQSFERFERAGIALGGTDNILRSFDILMGMMLQYKVNFYNDDLTEVVFDSDENAISAFELFASFGLPSKKNYSWNSYLSDADSAEQELKTFASGKLSMLMGYSYTYEDIVNEISVLAQDGEDTIDINDVKIQETPQVYDTDSSTETREAYASYFVPSVSRTSEHPEEAWAFLSSLVDEENLRYYYDETHRPSALRSLISEQMENPIYGVFASQVGYAKSIPMADPTAYKELFLAAIDSILDTMSAEDVIKLLADDIQDLIPSSGIKPTYVITETE